MIYNFLKWKNTVRHILLDITVNFQMQRATNVVQYNV